MNTKKARKRKSPPSAKMPQKYDWNKLLSAERLPGPERKKGITEKIVDRRTEHEKDLDRVVFSSPVRRLKDKTQVFPLDMHDGVRTRLTHSLEVSNLARSMGIAVVEEIPELKKQSQAFRNVPALLAAIALTHDLGNPPFGHQGEVAIRQWAKSIEPGLKKQKCFDADLMQDFIHFEGNAQGFRILTRLQHQGFKCGMRLTASTLRAFMKYPWTSTELSGSKGKIKKYGCFHSELSVLNWASEATGIAEKQRHPLSYLMEVCDDIAYSVLDLEDAVKKDLISVADIAAFIEGLEEHSADHRVADLLRQYRDDRRWLNQIQYHKEGMKEKVNLSSKEIRESQADILRSYAIGLLVSDAIEFFVQRVHTGKLSEIRKGIAEEFGGKYLVDAFKKFAQARIFNSSEVLKAELQGHIVLPELLEAFWGAVVRLDEGCPSKSDDYIVSLISPNYFRVFRESQELGLPLWYRQVQLACDQVCGMTDSYALRTHSSLKSLGVL